MIETFIPLYSKYLAVFSPVLVLLPKQIGSTDDRLVKNLALDVANLAKQIQPESNPSTVNLAAKYKYLRTDTY